MGVPSIEVPLIPGNSDSGFGLRHFRVSQNRAALSTLAFTHKEGRPSSLSGAWPYYRVYHNAEAQIQSLALVLAGNATETDFD